eukprot:4490491-Amphidinium_carterae.1
MRHPIRLTRKVRGVGFPRHFAILVGFPHGSSLILGLPLTKDLDYLAGGAQPIFHGEVAMFSHTQSST